jgi:hypothetical protein
MIADRYLQNKDRVMLNILQCLAYITLPCLIAGLIMYINEKGKVMSNDVDMILDRKEEGNVLYDD